MQFALDCAVKAMLLRHNLHAFSRQSACFFRQPFHAFVDENKRDTPVSPSFFSKMSEIWPFLNHFFQKQTRYTRISIIFHQNERNTPVSHLFFSKTSEIPPFLMLFLQNKSTCFFCFRHRFLAQQTREAGGLQAGDGGKRRKGDGQGQQKAWAICLNRRGCRRSD